MVCPECSSRQAAAASLRGVLEVELCDPPDAWPNEPLDDLAFLRRMLPLDETEPLAPLSVGNTPLLPAPRLRAQLVMPNLWLKDDTRNPSGSTKDRASLLVAAKAHTFGIDTIATASTGNAATALACICAASGQRAVVFVPASAPVGKLVQMMAYGPTLVPVDGSYDDAFELCQQACRELGWYNRNTAFNPFTIEGKKTLGLEIAQQLLPDRPDVVVVPSGDGVILAGVAKAFSDLVAWGMLEQAPRLLMVQPEGACALVDALTRGADDVTAVPGAASVADSLVVEAPRNARLALRRVRESGGAGVVVSDHAILEALGALARLTGVFAEPAAAASLAGLEVALERGLVDRDERIVLLVTGSGLKDREAAQKVVELPAPIEPNMDALRRRIR